MAESSTSFQKGNKNAANGAGIKTRFYKGMKPWNWKSGLNRKDYIHQYQLTHKSQLAEAARERSQERRLKLRFKILIRDDFTCQYCGRKSPQVELQIDHRFPKAHGGKGTIDNYSTACKDCNGGKGDIILNEFINKK